MQISAEVRNLGPVMDVLRRLSGSQAKAAYAKATNDTAYQVRRAMQAEMRTVFNAPTPYILKSSYVDQATPDRLSARIAPENKRDSVGVDPQKILQAQEFGGRRADKRSESALRRAGILPKGMQTAIPRQPFPGSDDGRGNLRGAFLQELLSYLQAFQSGNGFGGNMSAAARDRLHRFGKSKITKRAQQQQGPFMGRRYFVAGQHIVASFENGRSRIGPVTRKGTGHLQPGIWTVVGTGKLQPVLMFTRPAQYTPRLSMERVAAKADIQNYMDRRVRFRIREAAGV